MPADPTRDDWRRLRAENRLARERLESARLTAATRHQERRGRLLESLSLDWVTPYADLLDRFRSASDPILAGPSSAWQRRQGRNYPIYQTEQELNLLRAPARLLVATSGYAQGLLSGLTSYVIGSGYTYRVAKKTRESEAPDELVREVQRVVDDFLRRNQWYGGEQPGMEEELFERSVEDGEFALVDTPIVLRVDGVAVQINREACWTAAREAERLAAIERDYAEQALASLPFVHGDARGLLWIRKTSSGLAAPRCALYSRGVLVSAKLPG